MPSSIRPKPLVSGLALCLLLMTSCEIRQVGEPGGAESAAQPESEAPWDWTEERVFEAVNEVRAGRDLTPATWPGGARVAVALSFDVDNETIWLRNGDTNVGGLSQGEYGSRRALGRVLDALDEAEIPASFFIPAMSLTLAPEMADMIAEAGRHEFAVHGWIHERNTQLDAATERRLLEQSIDRLQEVTGVRPVGYRAPSWNFSPATLDIVMDLGFRYESSLMADDRPYEILQRGEPTGMVELPVDWILDDAPLMNPLGDRYSPPRDVLQVYIDEFDRAWEEGTLFVLTMHPHYIGHRSRIVVLEELIDHMRSRGAVWFATHLEVAEYVRAEAGMD
jgi:peptidoglycan/xylan/chitin deacetylase (PgdA/CDA1 family)